MKKNIFIALVCLAVLIALVPACNKSNPTSSDTSSPSGGDPGTGGTATYTNTFNTTPGTPTFTITVTQIPTTTPVTGANLGGQITLAASATGKQIFVIVDTDTNPMNGYEKYSSATLGSGLTYNYSFEVAAGSYYIIAVVDVNGDGWNEPMDGDQSGQAGPVSPTNLSVNFSLSQSATFTATSTHTVTFTRTPTTTFTSTSTFTATGTPQATSTPGTANVSGTLTLPSAAPGKTYKVVFDATGTYQTMIEITGVCGSQNTVNYSGTVPPDTYYVYAVVSVTSDGSGMPQLGDYMGAYQNAMPPAAKPLTVPGTGAATGVNITLSTCVNNVSGTVTIDYPALPGSMYYVAVMADGEKGPNEDMMTYTMGAYDGSGTVNYSLFWPMSGTHYVILEMMGEPFAGQIVGQHGVIPPLTTEPNTPYSTINPLTNNTFNFTAGPYLGGGKGAVKGNLTLPTAAPGMGYIVVLDTDLNPGNGTSWEVRSVCGAGTSVPYAMTATSGTYYMYAWIDTNGDCPTNECGITLGDFVGVAGSTYPAFPASPNVTIIEGTVTSQNITMVLGAANVFVHVDFSSEQAAAGADAACLVDWDTDGGNGYLAMSYQPALGTYKYADFSLLVPFPGTYYAYGLVDKEDPPGIYDGPSGNDYCGQAGPFSFTPSSPQSFTFTMSTCK